MNANAYKPAALLWRFLLAILLSIGVMVFLTWFNRENHQELLVSFPWECVEGVPPCASPSIRISFLNGALIFFPVLIVQELVVFFLAKRKRAL